MTVIEKINDINATIKEVFEFTQNNEKVKADFDEYLATIGARNISLNQIEKIFLKLIQKKNIDEISVSTICEKANLNRSTFYANYIDIYDLADKLKTQMINEFFSVYKDETEAKEHSYNFLKLFYHIKENQIFYKTYFKLNFDLSSNLIYELDNEAIKF